MMVFRFSIITLIAVELIPLAVIPVNLFVVAAMFYPKLCIMNTCRLRFRYQ